MTNAIIWTKNKNLECRAAMRLLGSLGFAVEERCIDDHGQWTKADMLAMVPSANTIPQIVIDGTVVGGIDAFRTAYAPQIKAAIDAAAAAKAASKLSPEAKSQAISDRASAARTAKVASKNDAIQAAREVPADSTRETRKAAIADKLAKTKARLNLNAQGPVMTPQGYAMGAQHGDKQMRFERAQAERAARTPNPAKVAAMAAHRQAKQDAVAANRAAKRPH
jgi:glutaredoxin